MSTLWNPLKSDVSAYNRGTRKVRIRNLLTDNKIELGKCPYCEKDVYLYESRDSILTESGSEHKCKGMRDSYDNRIRG